MNYMNQGDLFNLIANSDPKFAIQKDIARAIAFSSPCDLDVDALASNVSRAVNGGPGRPFDNLIGDNADSVKNFIDNFFMKIFKECNIRDGADRKFANDRFEQIKKYLSDNELTFNGKEKLESENAPCDEYIKQMILEAFRKHEPHSATVQASHAENSSTISNNNPPALHNQDIYCPNKFYGRADIIDEMREKLLSYKLVILCGLGGIGKTYLSRQYAYLYSHEYNCEQIVTYDKTSKSFKRAILSLLFDNIDESEMNDNDKVEKRLSLLNGMTSDTLLIIDNVDTTPDDLEYFDDLCTNSGIHIIVTTRLTNCFASEQTIRVSQLPPEDQITFFKSLYPEDIPNEDLPIIEEILRCIDGHTLLIELVAKSMHATALSPQEMLEYLQGDTTTELEPVSINKDKLSSEKRTMSDFVKLLFDVGNLDKEAKEALLYLSLLPVEGIKRRFIYNLMPTFRHPFNELISNSWAIEDEHDQIIRLHPVIRDLIRKETQPSFRNCAVLVQNLHNYMQTYGVKLSDSDKTDICKIFRSINEIDDFYKACKDVTLITYFAEFCFTAYDFELALNLYKVASEIAIMSPVQTRTSIYLKIGDVYKRLAMYKDSIESYNHALESNAQQQPCVEKELQNAEICLQLSDIYRKDGDYDAAISYSDKAIAIYEDSKNNANQKAIAEAYNRRGIIFLNKSDIKGTSDSDKTQYLGNALICYKKGLDIREEINDSLKQQAYSYHNIGTAYNKLGEYQLARENHEKALKLREESPDVAKTDIASSHVWIGNDYLALGNTFIDIAKSHFEQSLEIRESILGKTHPEVAWSLISLSEWYEKKGEIYKALEYAERAYKIRIAKFAPSHNYIKQITTRIEHLKSLT